MEMPFGRITTRRTAILFMLFAAVLLISCGKPGETAADEQAQSHKDAAVRVGDILLNPAVYSGREITITGEYRGWEPGYGTPPVTRSDWVLKDDTGGIYVSGILPSGLDPVDDRGTGITVYGVVKVTNGQVYIKAGEIRQ